MYTLLWSCPIEIYHMLIEHALELLLVVNQEGIETFATHATQKPSTDGTCSWGSISVLSNLMLVTAATRAKHDPNLQSGHLCFCYPTGILLPNELLGSTWTPYIGSTAQKEVHLVCLKLRRIV